MSGDPRLNFSIRPQLFGRAVTMPAPETGVLPESVPFTFIASAQYPTPVPLEVNLSTMPINNLGVDGVRSPFPTRVALATGQGVSGQEWDDGSGIGMGSWRITYGSGGHSRVLQCDLQSFRLYLGACTDVRVEAQRWTTDAVNASIIADADIQPSAGGASDEPTLTMWRTFSDLLVHDSFIPAYAHAWTPIIRASSGSRWWGTGGQVSFDGPQAVFIDGANYVQVPQFTRYEIGEVDTGTAISVQFAAGPYPACVGIKYWLTC